MKIQEIFEEPMGPQKNKKAGPQKNKKYAVFTSIDVYNNLNIKATPNIDVLNQQSLFDWVFQAIVYNRCNDYIFQSYNYLKAAISYWYLSSNYASPGRSDWEAKVGKRPVGKTSLMYSKFYTESMRWPIVDQ